MLNFHSVYIGKVVQNYVVDKNFNSDEAIKKSKILQQKNGLNSKKV